MSDLQDRGINVLVSFAPADAELQRSLSKHLAILRQIGDIRYWSNEHIDAGDNRYEALGTALEGADVVLLLLSADFLASDFIQEIEVPELLMQHERRGLRVIPVLLRTCAWEYHPWIGKLRPLPRSGSAIAARAEDDRDRALTEVVEEIANIAGTRRNARRPATGIPFDAHSGDVQPRTIASLRSTLKLAVPVALLCLGALVAGTQGRRLLDLVRPDDVACPPGRQRFDGACVANRMIDLLFCLKEHNATAALNVTVDVLRAAGDQQDHPATGIRLSQELWKLSTDERSQIYQFCLEAAGKAGVPLVPPLRFQFPFDPSTEDAGSTDADADVTADDRGSGAGTTYNGPPRDLLGCGGPLNHFGLCDDIGKSPCIVVGNPCSPNASCCGIYASCQQKVCKECAPRGGSCSGEKDCCPHLDLRCSDGVCVQCVSGGSACDKNVPCCSGLRCEGQICAAPLVGPTSVPRTCNCQPEDPLCSCL